MPRTNRLIQHCIVTIVSALVILHICTVGSMVYGQPTQGQKSKQERSPKVSISETAAIKKVIVEAFRETHQGYSSDEVVLQTKLNQDFVKACQKELPDSKAAQLNWTLLNLRKAGGLKVKTTRRERRTYDGVIPIAEMCARMMEDKHGKSIDRLMTDPDTQDEFNQAALAIDADVDTYLVRKAAFKLRKTRNLKPELITRIADWGRVVVEHKANDIEKQPDLVPDSPGIYIFRDSTGYLYIGEAIDLRVRLQEHLGGSDRKTLSDYLASQGIKNVTVEIHSFAANSRIKEIMVRRAYESELIRSRNPRFNIRP